MNYHSIKLASSVCGIAVLAVFLFHIAANSSANLAGEKRASENNLSSEPFMLHSGDFAEKVMKPQVKDLHISNQRVLPEILERLKRGMDGSLSGVLHGMHLFGPHMTVSGTQQSPVPAIELICNAENTRPFFGDRALLAPTRNGLRFPLFDELSLGTNQSNVQSHLGQGLAVLACSGIPLDREITLLGGKKRHVQDILNDLVANFLLKGEIYWDAVALTIYLPPNRTWKNKFGEEYSFDGLATELMRRSPDDSPCAGTHSLICLATLLRADIESPVLSDDVRDQLHSHLRAAVDQLQRAQGRDGCWSSDWMDKEIDKKSTPSAKSRILATGHHLEWLVLLPDSFQPDANVLKSAAEGVLALLWAATEDKKWVEEEYCPASHAARSSWIISDQKSPLMMDMSAYLKHRSQDSHN